MPGPQGTSWFTGFLRQDNSYQDPITNNLNINNPSYPYSSTFTALFTALGVNVRPLAKTDYYVDPVGGNDANLGTIGAPWQTFARASAVLAAVDFGGQTVTLHLVNNSTLGLTVPVWTGGGALTVNLGGKSISVASGNAFATPTSAVPGLLTVQNGTLAAANGFAFFGECAGSVKFGPGVVFDTSAFHILTARGCLLDFSAGGAGYSIHGGAQEHWHADTISAIANAGVPCTIHNTSGGALAFGTFARATDGGLIQTANVFFPASEWSTTTGLCANADFNGVISTFSNNNLRFFPGNSDAQHSTGGQYS